MFKTSGKITHHFRGIYEINLKLMKKHKKTGNRWDLEALARILDRVWPTVSADMDPIVPPA